MTPAPAEQGTVWRPWARAWNWAAAGVSGSRRGSVAGLSGATLLPTLLGALTGPLAARALAPSGRGQAAAISAFALFLPVLLSLGVPVAIGQRAATEPAVRPQLVASAVRFSLLTVPAGLAASAAALAGPLRSIGGAARVLAALALGVAPLVVLGFCLQQLLLAEGALGAYARVRAVPLMVNAGLTVGLFLAGWLTVATYVAAMLLANVAAVVVSVRFVGGQLGTSRRVWWPGSTRRILRAPASSGSPGACPLQPLVGFGLRSFFGTLANLTSARLDQMVMVPFLGSGPLGLYAVSVSVASLPQGVGQAIAARSFGSVAASADREGEAARYLRLTAVVVGAGCCVLGLVAPVVVPLVYGQPFTGAVGPLMLLLPGTVALALVFASSSTLQVLGRPGLSSWAEAAGVAVTVGGLALFLRPAGIGGAALVSTASYGVTFAINTVFLRKIGVRGLVPGFEDVHWVTGRVAGMATRALGVVVGRGCPDSRSPGNVGAGQPGPGGSAAGRPQTDGTEEG